MKCWICGNEANSGEHILKASDLSSIFGPVTTHAPLYKHTAKQKNQLIQGIKSDQLKSKARLCARCNNERTKPHDKAWEHLSAYLRGLDSAAQRPLWPTFGVELPHVGHELFKDSMNVGIGWGLCQVVRNLRNDQLGSLLVQR